MAPGSALTTFACLLLTLAGFAGAPADEPPLKEIVRRMTAYVQAYGEKASVVVATERYMQHVTGRGRSEPEDRLTVADFGIVKAQALGGWVGFRDVLEADGARIADHTDRLFKVLSDVSGRLDEARRLSDESARYNIGPVSRNFNVPTTALFFFSPENIERFKFTGKRVERDGICEITFQETRRPTLIKTPEGRSVPSEGSVWINASDGTVLRTFIRIKGFGRGSAAVTRDSGTAQVEVSYTRVPTLNMWLPEVMVESYETGRGPLLERTTAEARYSKYRVFQTSGRIK